MKILLIGASGFVGKYLLDYYSAEDVYSTYFDEQNNQPQLDITSKNDLKAVFDKIRPDLVLLPAAYSDVNGCEANPDKSFMINVTGVKNVTEFLGSAKLVFFSSDYVFDGKNGPYAETDKPNPLNVYGKHKLEAEAIVELLPNALIIRTVGIYGYNADSKNFVMSMIEDLKKGLHKQIPDDQVANPTYVENLVDGIGKLVASNKTGIYNVAGKDYVNRYEFAMQIAEVFDLDKSLIKPIKTAETDAAAIRPLNAGLKTDKIIKDVNFRPILAREGLAATKNLMDKRQ